MEYKYSPLGGKCDLKKEYLFIKHLLKFLKLVIKPHNHNPKDHNNRCLRRKNYNKKTTIVELLYWGHYEPQK